MTAEAKQRLAVLQRFTELGAGFQIASHDLEIRGAGELLGAEQSGAIAAVGFETYAQILEEAVAELQGEPIEHERDPELTVDVPAFIPDDYVPDAGQRLDLYRRLSQARDEDDVRATLAEIADRYGPLPDEARLLGELMVVKTLVRSARRARLRARPGAPRAVAAPATPARAGAGDEAGAAKEPLEADARHAPLLHLRRGGEARSHGGGARPLDAPRALTSTPEWPSCLGRPRYGVRAKLRRMYIAPAPRSAHPRPCWRSTRVRCRRVQVRRTSDRPSWWRSSSRCSTSSWAG